MADNNNYLDRFEFREIKSDEVERAIFIEQTCFPPNEACSLTSMKNRIEKAADYFLVAFDKETGIIAGFLNGVATNEDKFRDEFFTDISLHDVKGINVMLLGLDVMPDYRMKGLARKIVTEYSKLAVSKGCKALYLTCLDSRVSMYLKFGFEDLGIANSTWGGEEWHEMILKL